MGVSSALITWARMIRARIAVFAAATAAAARPIMACTNPGEGPAPANAPISPAQRCTGMAGAAIRSPHHACIPTPSLSVAAAPVPDGAGRRAQPPGLRPAPRVRGGARRATRRGRRQNDHTRPASPPALSNQHDTPGRHPEDRLAVSLARPIAYCRHPSTDLNVYPDPGLHPDPGVEKSLHDRLGPILAEVDRRHVGLTPGRDQTGSAPGGWLDPRARAHPDRHSGSEADGAYRLVYNVAGQRLSAILVPRV